MTGIITTAESDTIKLNSDENLTLFTRNHIAAAGARKDSGTESDQQTDLPNLEAFLSREDAIELEDIEGKSCHEMESVSNDRTVSASVVDTDDYAKKFFMTEQEKIKKHEELEN